MSDVLVKRNCSFSPAKLLYRDCARLLRINKQEEKRQQGVQDYKSKGPIRSHGLQKDHLAQEEKEIALTHEIRFLVFLLSVAIAFASDLDFTLVNQTGRSFEGLYITASDNKDWDANLLLDGEVLAAGARIQVRFKRDAKSEFWDFNLVDDEGLSVTFNKVDLAGVDTVTLKDINGTMTAEIE